MNTLIKNLKHDLLISNIIYTINKIFTPDQFDDIYWNNPLRAFPKVAEYLKMKG